MALYRLLASPLSASINHQVICLGRDGPVGEKIRQSGVTVRNLKINPKFPNALKLFTLRKWLKAAAPDIVQTWMYHANLFGGIVAKFTDDIPVVWSIRQDIRDRSWIKPSTNWVINMGSRLARVIPDKIISVSERAVSSHVKNGYPNEKFTVIPNGFNTSVFLPNPSARKSVRDELGLEKSVKLVGFFARDHPVKDHKTFLRAAQLVHKRLPNLHFMLCGTGIDNNNRELIREIEQAGLNNFVHVLGLREDIPRLYAALDIYTISSLSEGLPSSVGEAMACGVPCVVTNVGDAAKLVGDTGITVLPGSPTDLADGWIKLLASLEKRGLALSKAARDRIIENFGFEKMLKNYDRIYVELTN